MSAWQYMINGRPYVVTGHAGRWWAVESHLGRTIGGPYQTRREAVAAVKSGNL